MLDTLKEVGSVVICDIDGTIADCTHRLHFIKNRPKRFDKFFAAAGEDTPLWDVIKSVRDLVLQGKQLVFVTARPERNRDTTVAWFQKHLPEELLGYKALIMRKDGDFREDSEIKQEILNEHFPDKKVVYCVYDDRPRVIRMWEGNGLTVIPCGNGEEF